MVSREKFREGLKRADLGITEKQIDTIFTVLDMDGKDQVGYKEVASCLAPDLNMAFELEHSQNDVEETVPEKQVKVQERYRLMMQMKKDRARQILREGTVFTKFCKKLYGLPMHAWSQLDKDHTMEVTKTDFLRWAAEVNYPGNRLAAWKCYDKDDSGSITLDEFSLPAAIALAQFHDFYTNNFICQTDLYLQLFCFGGKKRSRLTIPEFSQRMTELNFFRRSSSWGAGGGGQRVVIKRDWDSDHFCSRCYNNIPVSHFSPPCYVSLPTVPALSGAVVRSSTACSVFFVPPPPSIP